jgi:hypothetical protein
MSMKKIHVEFDLDPDLFMRMLQHGSSSMKIEVYGDDKPPKVSKEERKLLPAPSRERIAGGAKNLIMQYAKQHPDGFVAGDVRPIVVEAGYAPTTHSPQLMELKAKGFLRRKDGVYSPTAKGMTYGEG